MSEWRAVAKDWTARAVAMTLLSPLVAWPQVADFQIVWVSVGEVAAAQDGHTARAGRQLFMAPDLVQFSLNKVTVARIDIEPAVVSLNVGQQFCLTSLHVLANGDDHTEVANAPLSVSVRQDQRERLSIQRAKSNICFTPSSPGEYPIRFNSLLPARDGTTRGAQIFLRVQGEDAEPDSTTTTPTVSALMYRPLDSRS